jgi:TonB family protein
VPELIMALTIQTPLPDVCTLDEIARAAGAPLARIEELADRSELPTLEVGGDRYVAWSDAVTAVQTLTRRGSMASLNLTGQTERPLFRPQSGTRRSAGMPIALSSAVHAGVVATSIVLTTVGLTPASPVVESTQARVPMRLVYLATPGPGGGGGGGGLKQRTPPPKAERQGRARLSSPLPARKQPDPIVPVEKPPEPKPEVLKAEPLKPVVAPVVTAPADTRDRAGVLEQVPAKTESRGPGEGGGVGTGRGTGIGEGDGTGIGPGSGGGTGGGPYRPGSGISPPRLLREVKPDYTEEARQRNIEGEVVLEIVVRQDGSVGDIKLIDGLGYGLNERAMAAVRQWRFSPAQRRGAAVDVLVEVAVEFRLR